MEKELQIVQESQQQNEEINQQCKDMMNLTVKYCNNIQKLADRVETLEKMIAKVPEFYEYWKRLNACGYQD